MDEVLTAMFALLCLGIFVGLIGGYYIFGEDITDTFTCDEGVEQQLIKIKGQLDYSSEIIQQQNTDILLKLINESEGIFVFDSSDCFFNTNQQQWYCEK